MRQGRYRQQGGHVPFGHLQLWLAAILLFGVGDLATAAIGVGLADRLESGVTVAPMLSGYGPRTVVTAKLGAFVGCFGLWQSLPRPYRAAAPVGLALLGATLAGWRILVVTTLLVG